VPRAVKRKCLIRFYLEAKWLKPCHQKFIDQLMSAFFCDANHLGRGEFVLNREEIVGAAIRAALRQLNKLQHPATNLEKLYRGFSP
jgi:hypothetical protein